MLKKSVALSVALMAAIPGALAEEARDDLLPGDFSANVALTSDYVFRGISQTDENPALQGGIDWSHEAGPYLGVWGSNVDFNDNSEASLELDVYGGMKGELAGLGWDVGVIGYLYPGAEDALDYDFYEVKLALSRSFGEMVSAGVSYFYSPDFFGTEDDAHYLGGAVTVAPGLPLGLSFTGTLGHQWLDQGVDYADWSVGVAAEVEGFVLSATYVDTDLDESDCPDLCDARGVFKVSRAF